MRYADEIFTALKVTGSRFFSVTFRCRTPAKNEAGQIVAPAGRIRKMVCRTGVNRFKLGAVSDIHREQEDFRNAILTVWDIGKFFELRERGMSRMQAGRRSYRRVNLLEIQEGPSIISDMIQLPVRIRPRIHRITNQWQLQRLAQQGLNGNGVRM